MLKPRKLFQALGTGFAEFKETYSLEGAKDYWFRVVTEIFSGNGYRLQRDPNLITIFRNGYAKASAWSENGYPRFFTQDKEASQLFDLAEERFKREHGSDKNAKKRVA